MKMEYLLMPDSGCGGGRIFTLHLMNRLNKTMSDIFYFVCVLFFQVIPFSDILKMIRQRARTTNIHIYTQTRAYEYTHIQINFESKTTFVL